MRLTLVHNPTAGEESHSRDGLLGLLRQAGHQVAYQSIMDDGIASALEDPGELVVAAGGDGTIGKVVRELAGREIPIAVLPLGTANNIARSLGVKGPVSHLIAGWGTALRRQLRVGVVQGTWGERRFVEAVGLGVFPWTMRRVRQRQETISAPPAGHAEIARDVRVLVEVLRRCSPGRWTVILDGEDLSGEYVALEAMNISCIGPNLALAPGADPGDEWLDVVLVPEREREELAAYFARLLRGSTAPPELQIRRGRRLQLTWDPSALHIDDDSVDEIAGSDEPRRKESRAATVSVTLEGGRTVEFLT